MKEADLWVTLFGNDKFKQLVMKLPLSPPSLLFLIQIIASGGAFFDTNRNDLIQSLQTQLSNLPKPVDKNRYQHEIMSCVRNGICQ